MTVENDIEGKASSDPICPWCNYKIPDVEGWLDFLDNEPQEITCPYDDCERKFTVTFFTNYTFYCEKVGGDEDE